jgi:acylphosphatase
VKTRVRVIVSGSVQGVFFRTTCAAEARRRGVAGSVRNLPDARVEAVFEGPSGQVDEMVEWCRRGPDLARVDDVETVALEPVGESGFRVEG